MTSLDETPPGSGAPQWRGIIEEYRARLPVSADTPVVTLREGGTPLVRSEVLSAETGCDVWLKYDGANPTGSFKDRGMTLAISKALEEGAKAIVCASTGNTSASAAAYAAKAGLTCAVLVPKGKIALGKMAQTLVHGARVLEVDGNFDASLELAKDLADRYPVTLVNSVNPFRLEGQKTAAFEICDALGRAPDLHFVPVGNAGNISSHWLGYTEYLEAGMIHEPPRLFGFQAQGAAPIVLGQPVKDPQTIATAIRIGNPASWEKAVAAAKESEGAILAVTDREILAAYRRVAREGLFAEPASAASVAGLLHLHAEGKLAPDATVVCVLTGHGLKDPEWAIAGAAQPRDRSGRSRRGGRRAGALGARHRPGAGLVGEPRPGIRLLRARARSLQRGDGRHRGRARRHVGRAREPTSSRPTASDMVSRAIAHTLEQQRRFHPERGAPVVLAPRRQSDPARTRPRVFLGRSRRGCRPCQRPARRGRDECHAGGSVHRSSRTRLESRGIPTTPRPRSTGASPFVATRISCIDSIRIPTSTLSCSCPNDSGCRRRKPESARRGRSTRRDAVFNIGHASLAVVALTQGP